MGKHEIKNIKKTSEVKKKRKMWVTIFAPEMFNNVEVGESYCSAPEALLGRVVNANMMVLSQDPKRQGTTAALKITQVKGDKVGTEFAGMFVGGAHLKRLVRRETSKIEDSFVVEGKDKSRYEIKPVAVTRKKAHHSTQTDLRNKWREIIASEFATKDAGEVINAIIFGRFQKDLKDSLRKIAHIGILEIKSIRKLK